MPWFTLALLTAFWASLSDVFTKAFLKGLSTPQLALARVLGPVACLAPLLLIVNKPDLDSTFFKSLLCLLPLETLALLLYMEAIRIAPLSLTIPFLAFTPVFMILTGFVILGETLELQGIVGILLTVAGSYTLHVKNINHGLFTPVKKIFSDRGSILMITVAFIYSITSVLGKVAVLHSSPLFFAIFYFVIHGLFAATVISLWQKINPLEVILKNRLGFVSVAFSQSFMVVCHMAAISMAPAAYMIAVKRTSVLFGVIFGCLIFKEKDFPWRFLGAALMFLGVVLISFSKF